MPTFSRFLLVSSSSLLVLLHGAVACDLSAEAEVEVEGTPPSTLSRGDASAGCDTLIRAFCDKLDACSASYIPLVYGDVGTCVDLNRELCTTDFLLPGTSLTQGDLEGCGAVLSGLSCEDVATGGVGWDRCGFRGVAEEATACVVGSQCASGLCSGSSSQQCGVCAPDGEAAAGQACATDLDCAEELRCGAGVCVQPVAVGGACDASRPCGSWLTCADGVCASRGGPGETCSNDPAAECKSLDQYCSFESGTCVDYAVLAPGEACEAGLGLCANGSCSASTGTCETNAQLGQACDAAVGCTYPAGCFDGVCAVFSVEQDPCTYEAPGG